MDDHALLEESLPEPIREAFVRRLERRYVEELSHLDDREAFLSAHGGEGLLRLRERRALLQGALAELQADVCAQQVPSMIKLPLKLEHPDDSA